MANGKNCFVSQIGVFWDRTKLKWKLMIIALKFNERKECQLVVNCFVDTAQRDLGLLIVKASALMCRPVDVFCQVLHVHSSDLPSKWPLNVSDNEIFGRNLTIESSCDPKSLIISLRSSYFHDCITNRALQQSAHRVDYIADQQE